MATAQTGYWNTQRIPTGLPMLYDIDMRNTSWGLAVGQSDIVGGRGYSGVMWTNDGGGTWYMMESMSPRFTPDLPDYTVWRAVYILDDRIAVIVGDSALAYRTRDAGLTWRKDSLFLNPNFASRPTLHDVVLLDDRRGYIVGGDGMQAAKNGGELHATCTWHTNNGGTLWMDVTPSAPQFGYNGGAFLACAYVDNTLFAVGEYGLFGVFSGGSWQQQYVVNPPGMYSQVYKGIDAKSVTEFFIVGEDMYTKAPYAYRSIRGGSRIVSMLPPNLPAGIEGINDVYFHDVDNGWIGTGQHYTALTNDNGSTWTTFRVGTVPPPTTPMTGLDFVDPLNGWACGGDATANTSWIMRFFGSPPKPDLSTTDTDVNFGSSECEKSIEADVVIRNAGTGDLTIGPGGISFNSPELSVVSPGYPITVRPKKSVVVRVRWTPGRTAFGDVTALMNVVSNDPDHNPWVVALRLNRRYGALDFVQNQQVSYGTCLKDTMIYPTVFASIGNRAPTFLGIQFVSGHNDFALLSPAPGKVVNGSEIFTFRFAPKDTAMRVGTYRIIHGNPGCPDTTLLTLSGLGQRTIVQPSVTVIDFGDVCKGARRDSLITLRNVGNTFAMGGTLDHVSGDPMFGSPDFAVYIQQDSTKKYPVFFTPFKTGAIEGRYRLVSGLCPDTVYFTFRGRGIETKLEITPKSPIRLGPIFVNRFTAQQVTITNTGTTPARITDISLAHAYPSLQLSGVPALPAPLLPAQSILVTLRYSPVKIEDLTTRLIVRWDSRCPDTIAAEINAICVPNPEIEAPSSADLGVQECPQALRDTIWIKNLGNGPLVFYSATVTGKDFSHFRIIRPQINDTARAKSNYPVIVEFNRPTAGRSNAILRFTHNDFEAGLTDIAVTAERTVSEFIAEGDTGTAYFTRLFVPETRTYTIRNTSTKVMTITDIQVTREAGVFAVQPAVTLPHALQPGGTMTFDVIFTPNARGPFDGQVIISGIPCDLTIAMNLRGSGDTDGLSPDKGNLDFVLDPCSFTGSCQDIVLRNQSPEAVEVSGLTILQSGSTFAIAPAISTPFTLGANGERTVRICALPGAIGQQVGTLQIRSNDPAYPLLTVALRSTRDSSAIMVSTDAISFGRLADCKSASTRRVTITNTGTLPETVTPSLQTGTAFAISMAGPETIQPGKSYSFDVTYLRPGYGVHSDVIELRSSRCNTLWSIALDAESVEQGYVLAPDPVLFATVNVGGTTTRQITLQNTGGFDATIASVTIQPNGPFTLQGAVPSSIAAGGSENMSLRFSPTAEGSFAATVCVIISAPCPDTLCVSLSGSAVRGTLVLRPSLLAFGTHAQCGEVILEDTLTNTGSGTISIIAASITGSGAAAFTNLTPVGAAEPIAAGGTRIFRVRYRAANAPADGPVLAALQVRTDDNVLPVFDVPLEAGRVTQVVDAGGSVAFGVTEVGLTEQRTVTVRNNGSTRYCYSSVSLPSNYTMTPMPPICLDPGQSTTLTLDFTAPAPGSFNGRLVLGVTAPCADSTVFQLSASAQEGTLTQTDTVRLPAAPWCETRGFAFTARSSYLEDITLDELRLEGADAAFFRLLSPDPASLPLQISSGGTQNFSVELVPDQRSRVLTVTVVARYTAFGTPVELRTVLIAEAVVPTLSIESATFPPTVLGQSGGTRTVRLRNTSSIAVDIASVLSANAAFPIRAMSRVTPLTLAPGEEITITVEFLPQVVGVVGDSVRVQSPSPCAFSIAGQLSGEGIPQPIVDARLTLGAVQGEVDQIVDIPLYVDKTLAGASVTGWSAAINFNRSMLYPVELIVAGTPSSAFTANFTWDYSTSTVALRTTGSGFMGDGVGPIAILRCRVLVGDALSTELTLSSFAFNGGYARVAGLVNGSFTLLNYCMPAERLMIDRPGFTVRQNAPNPVSLGRHSSTSISFITPESTHMRLYVTDMVGRVLREQDLGEVAAGAHSVALPVQGLQPGVYHYMLRSDTHVAAKAMVVVE